MDTKTNPYAGCRYPTEIIRPAVWLYFRFTLSFRDVEEILASRGMIVSDETIRQWALKVWQAYATTLRHRQPRRGGTWNLDEVMSTMNGKHHFLWRAVDQNGYALDILMQSRRDRTATTRVFRTLLKGLCHVPRTIITDTLKSYGAATRDIMPGVERRQHKGLNNQTELSHQPTRQQGRQRRRFTSLRPAQMVLATHAHSGNLSRMRHRHSTAAGYRAARNQAYEVWEEATCAHRVAGGHVSRSLRPNILC